jgi:hypothetical protein
MYYSGIVIATTIHISTETGKPMEQEQFLKRKSLYKHTS